MKTKLNWKRLFEIFLTLIAVFIVIMIVFGVAHYSFKHIKKSISGKIIFSENSEEVGTLGWFIISFVTATIVVGILNYISKKDFFKINWD
ncbi:MAG: hypothetical protein ABIH59_01635 [archaeon]